MDSVGLFDQSHRRMRTLLSSGAPVFLSVNPVEYHGPHLSLHNDRLLSGGVIRDLHAALAAADASRDWPLLIGADLEVGVDPAPGPGTRITSYRATVSLVEEACRALVAVGAKSVVLVTFHGGALHGQAMEAGVRLLRRAGLQAVAPFHALMRELMTLDPVRYADAVQPVADPELRAQLLKELPLDFHAGFFETSVALHYAPDSVDPCRLDLPDCPAWGRDRLVAGLSRIAGRLGASDAAQEMEFASRAAGWGRMRPFPGYTGRPRLANAESGRAFARHGLRAFLPVVEEALAGGTPDLPPVMGWLRTLSLGGRIPRGGNLGSEDVTS